MTERPLRTASPEPTRSSYKFCTNRPIQLPAIEFGFLSTLWGRFPINDVLYERRRNYITPEGNGFLCRCAKSGLTFSSWLPSAIVRSALNEFAKMPTVFQNHIVRIWNSIFL